VRTKPNDLHAAERLADAYMLNQEYDKTIDFSASMHRNYPDVPSFQHFMLDALLALGKTEDDVDWVVKPSITRLTLDFADRCYDYLRRKRTPQTLIEISLTIRQDDYLAFSDAELLRYLEQDGRFVIAGDHAATANVSVARPTRSRTSG
jgi:hypothetical protein